MEFEVNNRISMFMSTDHFLSGSGSDRWHPPYMLDSHVWHNKPTDRQRFWNLADWQTGDSSLEFRISAKIFLAPNFRKKSAAPYQLYHQNIKRHYLRSFLVAGRRNSELLNIRELKWPVDRPNPILDPFARGLYPMINVLHDYKFSN